MDDLNALQGFYIGLGLDQAAADNVIKYCGLRNLDLIQRKIQECQSCLRINQATMVRMLMRCPSLLGHDFAGRAATSVTSKIKNIQQIFDVDEQTALKMIVSNPALLGYDYFGHQPSSIQSKVVFYQKTLQTDLASIVKMILSFPSVLNFVL